MRGSRDDVSEVLGSDIAVNHWHRAKESLRRIDRAPVDMRVQPSLEAAAHALLAQAARQPKADVRPMLRYAYTQVNEELRRAETKATILFSFMGVVLAVAGESILPAVQSLPWLTVVALGVAGLPLVYSAYLLLSTIAPRLPERTDAGTWLHASLHGPETLLDDELEGERVVAQQAAALARVARRKHALVSRAVWALPVGVVAMVVVGVAHLIVA